MPDVTMKRERTDRWTKMRLSLARSSGTAASCHMLSSVDCITTTSESEFSVHTTPQLRQETAALRDFDPAYDRFGSNASHRHARDVRAMPASHPITIDLVRHNEPARCANNGLMQRSNVAAYSSTASARSKNDSGILRPMAFAVLRLMANSNFVGCSMGMSFGCRPCKILCTNLAPCRNVAGPSAPKDIRPPISTNARVLDAAGRRYLIAISVRGLIAKLPCTTTAST